MGKKAPKVVQGRSQQQRKAVRQKLGKLKDLTVQPRTRQRYEASLQQFFSWLEREGLSLPKRWTIWSVTTLNTYGLMDMANQRRTMPLQHFKTLTQIYVESFPEVGGC